MIVHDVIARVARDAQTSAPKGSYAVAMFADLGAARRAANRFQECCSVPGIAYTVHSVDEVSPDRFPTEVMIQRGEALG